jgi:hypothetical protein
MQSLQEIEMSNITKPAKPYKLLFNDCIKLYNQFDEGTLQHSFNMGIILSSLHKFVKENCKSKDELENCKSKDELENCKSKDELENCKLKDELENCKLKDELENSNISVNMSELKPFWIKYLRYFLKFNRKRILVSTFKILYIVTEQIDKSLANALLKLIP